MAVFYRYYQQNFSLNQLEWFEKKMQNTCIYLLRMHFFNCKKEFEIWRRVTTKDLSFGHNAERSSSRLIEMFFKAPPFRWKVLHIVLLSEFRNVRKFWGYGKEEINPLFDVD